MYLVSVGATKFDGLVEAADNLSLHGGPFQIADGEQWAYSMIKLDRQFPPSPPIAKP